LSLHRFLVGTGGGLAGSPASSLMDSGRCLVAETAEPTADAAAAARFDPDDVLNTIFLF
jgi:hypothetical protein